MDNLNIKFKAIEFARETMHDERLAARLAAIPSSEFNEACLIELQCFHDERMRNVDEEKRRADFARTIEAYETSTKILRDLKHACANNWIAYQKLDHAESHLDKVMREHFAEA